MKSLAASLVLAVTLTGLGSLHAPDAAAQRYRIDPARSGTYVPSLFSEDKEIDCTLSRGVTRLCLSVPDRLAKPRRRIRALKRAGRIEGRRVGRHRTRRD